MGNRGWHGLVKEHYERKTTFLFQVGVDIHQDLVGQRDTPREKQRDGGLRKLSMMSSCIESHDPSIVDNYSWMSDAPVFQLCINKDARRTQQSM